MHYLITGGAGFIGSNLAHALVGRGCEVTVLDNLSTGRLDNLDGVLTRLRFIEGSILDRTLVESLLPSVDVVLHQAAMPSVPKSIEMPLESNDANIKGTLTILEACKSVGVKRIVYASSSSTYGDHNAQVKTEDLPRRPKSPYAVQKVTKELYAQAYHELFGLETVGLRYFNVFGPRQNPASQYAAVVPAFITKMLSGASPTIYGDGSQSRDFTFIDNVIEMNLAAASVPLTGGQVFNCGCGQSTSVLDLQKSINQILGTKITPVFETARAGDVQHSLAGLENAKSSLGWAPTVNLIEGLRQTIDWYRELV